MYNGNIFDLKDLINDFITHTPFSLYKSFWGFFKLNLQSKCDN